MTLRTTNIWQNVKSRYIAECEELNIALLITLVVEDLSLTYIYIYLTEVAKNALNYLHTQVASLYKKSLKNIVCGSGYFKYIQWYNAALDSNESKLI